MEHREISEKPHKLSQCGSVFSTLCTESVYEVTVTAYDYFPFSIRIFIALSNHINQT
jgi:hypothetical protein